MWISKHWSLSHFDYTLPPHLIAQKPSKLRDRSRLMVSYPHGLYDRVFSSLPEFLDAGDLLILNDTEVVSSRLMAKKETGGRVELLLLNPLSEVDHWHSLANSNKRIVPGLRVIIGSGFYAHFLERLDQGFRVRLVSDHEPIVDAIKRYGALPLPPYITDSDPEQDKKRYQTVFARHAGAVAAPTAGLHFTSRLLARLRSRGVQIATVTLHVGPGTFQPVRCENLSSHVMHKERFILSQATARKINVTQQRGGRVVAVGTTALRVLESSALKSGRVVPFSGETQLFIRPGYRFRVVDALITNFHLPKSTLLMLVAAFVGKRCQERDYAHALNHRYRFYSYGDATLLFNK